MATRPTPRPRDCSGARPRSMGGRPTSSYAAGTGQQPARSSFSGSPACDRPTPSFLRPTVSSSMHSSSSTSALPSSSKGCASTLKRSTDKAAAMPITLRRSFTDKAMCAPGAITPKRPSTDKAPVRPVSAPRPVTPPAKAKANGAAASRGSAVVPRKLIKRASTASNGTTPRSKTSKDVAGDAASASNKEKAGASGDTKTATARGQSIDKEKEHQPTETTVLPPPDVQAEEVVEPPRSAARNEQLEDAEAGDAVPVVVQEETIMLEESEFEAVNVETPEMEEKQQNGVTTEAETEVQNDSEDGLLPPVAVVEAVAEESAPLTGQDEPAASTVERQREESPEPEELTESSESSVISEEPKELPAAEQSEVVDGQPKLTVAASRALSVPATSLEQVLADMDTMATMTRVSASEPVTPEKAPTETLLSASAPATPAKGAGKTKDQRPTSSMARISEDSRAAGHLTFNGTRVKTAMEKRAEEAQPKKKEVTRSNDVIEETKSKLLEKRKSQVRALVGAFETVMDSPSGSSTPTKSPTFAG